MTILVNPFRAGSGIDINYNTGTIANSGVLSVDSNTGNLTLSAGTGISISGLTITNTGVDSLVAGTGISLSATTGSVTVTNSGVTSFQGDTGSISLSAGTGISISGLTISNAGVTSLQSETGALSLTAGTGISISGLTITNTGITSLTAGNGISVSGSTIAMSGSYSGNFTASGIGTFATINANSADTVGGKGGDEIIALYGGLQSFPSSTTGSMYGFGISSSTLESYASTNFNFWQLTFSTSTPAFSIGGADDTGGTQFLVKTANNILDDGTGNLQIGNFYYKWSNSANNYVYADTANMVFGTNGGFQWKNSSNTIITTLSSDGSMAMTGSLTVDSNLYVTGSIGVILGQNTAAAYSGIGTDGTIRDWLGYQDSGSDNLYLRSPAGDLYLAASGAVATGTTGVPTTTRNTLDDGAGNMSVAGGLSVSSTTVLGHSGGTNGVTIYAYTPDNVLGRFGTFNLKGEGGLFISSAADNGLDFGFFMVEDQNSGQLGFYNLGSSSYAGLNANSYTISILTAANGSLYTYATQNTSLGSAIGLTPRNTLDNGSGDMSIAGYATGGFAQFFNSGTIRVSVQALSYSITLPAGTWAGFITVGIFFVPLSNTYSYQIGVNLSGSAFVSGSTHGYSTLTNIAGGSGSNYPLDNFPPIPLEIESSGGTITFDVVNSDATDGMTSIFSGNSDNAFVITVFLVSTGTAS